MSIANGYGIPGISVLKKDGTTVTVTMPTKLPEVNEEKPVQVDVKDTAFDFEDILDHVGFKPEWTISYENWLDGTELLALRHLLENLAVTIWLTPHVDLAGRKFEVSLVSFGVIKREGPDSDARHVGVKLQFRSTKLLDAIPFPQASLSGKTLIGMGTDTLADHSADVLHFYL